LDEDDEDFETKVNRQYAHPIIKEIVNKDASKEEESTDVGSDEKKFDRK